MSAEQPILRALNVSRHFGSGHTEIRAVDQVTLAVKRSELAIIMGPSGSGKTTLLPMLGALLKPSSGQIFIDGLDVTTQDQNQLAQLRSRKIGFVFQAFNLLESLTVEENILLPAQLTSGGIRGARAWGRKLLNRLGLNPRIDSLPNTLSGGEKQRVAIARALINRPPLLLADEPTGNLDSVGGQEVTMILHDLALDEGCAVVIVTHDVRVEEVADQILWLEDGALRERSRDSHHWVQDPVCGMRVDEWTAMNVREHDGRKYVFCSHRCLERFSENPHKYRIDAKPGAKSTSNPART